MEILWIFEEKGRKKGHLDREKKIDDFRVKLEMYYIKLNTYKDYVI